MGDGGEDFAAVGPEPAAVGRGEQAFRPDPAVFEDTDSDYVFLPYAVAGESGSAIAEVYLDE